MKFYKFHPEEKFTSKTQFICKHTLIIKDNRHHSDVNCTCSDILVVNFELLPQNMH